MQLNLKLGFQHFWEFPLLTYDSDEMFLVRYWDWKSSICEDYAIRGIPRFLLIDKDGNIIDKNAPRPSSKEIKDILADLSKPGYTSMK